MYENILWHCSFEDTERKTIMYGTYEKLLQLGAERTKNNKEPVSITTKKYKHNSELRNRKHRSQYNNYICEEQKA